MKNIIALIFFIGLIGYSIYTAAFTGKTEIVGLEVGNTAPDFELVTLSGEDVKLSDYRGKKVLLNFWASWCGPCRDEMPDIQKLHEEHDDFIILSVNAFNTEISKESVAAFVNELGLTFPILLDELGEVSSTYQVITVPTSYFIDSDGLISEKYIGVLSDDEIVNKFSTID